MDLLPATKARDLHQLNPCEALGILLQNLLRAWPIIVLRSELLSFNRVEEIEIGFCSFAGTASVHDLVDDGNGWLGQNADRRYHNLKAFWTYFMRCQKGFVFPRDQDIADTAACECDCRTARTGVEHRSVAVDSCEQVPSSALVVAVLAYGIAPRRHEVPPRPARSLRIGCHHSDAFARQIRPVANLFGVTLAHQEHNGRGVRRAVVGQSPLPVRLQQTRAMSNGVDIMSKSEGDDTRLEPETHRPRLCAGAGMRLVNDDVLPLSLPPGGGERLVHGRIKAARWLVRCVKQRRFGTMRRCRQQLPKRPGDQGQEKMQAHARFPCPNTRNAHRLGAVPALLFGNCRSLRRSRKGRRLAGAAIFAASAACDHCRHAPHIVCKMQSLSDGADRCCARPERL